MLIISHDPPGQVTSEYHIASPGNWPNTRTMSRAPTAWRQCAPNCCKNTPTSTWR